MSVETDHFSSSAPAPMSPPVAADVQTQQSAMDASATCFHCDEPLEKTPIVRTVLGKERAFCCHGCAAVAQLITDSGHEDYYRFREQYATDKKMPDQLWRKLASGSAAQAQPVASHTSADALKHYDDPDFQRRFVTSAPDGTVSARLLLEGIRCAACVWLNENYVREMDGVESVQVDYGSGQMQVCWHPGVIRLSEILAAVAALGYQAYPFDARQREKLESESRRKNLTRLLFALILSMEVMAHAVATYVMGGADATGQLPLWEKIGRWTDWLVVTAMLVYVGADFFLSAWRDVRNRHLGMDVPIVLGLSIAWLASGYATVTQKGHVYFDSIAMFLTLMMAARYFELQARLQAAAWFDRLLKLVPGTVWRKVTEPDNSRPSHTGWKKVAISQVKVGDTVRVLAGEAVPLDGRLISAGGLFQEAHLTGEALPVGKKTGDPVTAGSLAIDQAVQLQVTATEDQSTVNRLVEMASQGGATKPRLAQLADQVASRFVFAVIVLGAVTGLYWYWSEPSMLVPTVIAVLIVTCPCALGLAAPVVLSLANAAYARGGILVLNASASESVAQADIWAFDKTGTLTRGEPRVVKVIAADNAGSARTKYWLAVAAALECDSNHPLARAFSQENLQNVLKTDKPEPLRAEHVRNYPGQGLEGWVDGALWRFGSVDFCGGEKALPAKWRQYLGREDAVHGAQTMVVLTCNTQPVALFLLRDTLRPGVAKTIDFLRKQTSASVVILSGDQPLSVAAVARQLGVENWQAGARPDDKLQWIQAQQQAGKRVIFVGDGINDVPVLAAADVSVSFLHAAELARVQSDFVLPGENFSVIRQLVCIARRSRMLIQQNFMWALAYNSLAIPAAAMGLVPPWLAALGMAGSSMVVVANSLRMKAQP